MVARGLSHAIKLQTPLNKNPKACSPQTRKVAVLPEAVSPKISGLGPPPRAHNEIESVRGTMGAEAMINLSESRAYGFRKS